MRAVNLIPSEQRTGGTVGTRSKGAVFVVLGVLAGFVVLVGLYAVARHQIASRTSQAAALTAQAQEVQARAQALAPYTSFVAMREQRLQAVSQLIGDRFDWAHALHELGRVLPYDTSLSSIQGTIGLATGTGTGSGTASAASTASTSTTPSAASTSTTAASGSASAAPAPVASATPPGATPTMTIAGCAVSQSEVALTLVRLHEMDGVGNVVLQSSTKSSSSAGSGTCPAGDPAFSLQVTFQPLPAPAALKPGAFGSATPASSGAAATPSRAAVSAASTGSLR
jgi:Tfp pilus assembly protein PilN